MLQIDKMLPGLGVQLFCGDRVSVWPDGKSSGHGGCDGCTTM